MSRIRLSRVLIGLALLAGMLLAAAPAAPAYALSGPAGAGGATTLSAGTSPALPSAASCRVFVKDRRVTYEHRGNLTIVHVSETIVTECNGKVVSTRHVSYTYVRR